VDSGNPQDLYRVFHGCSLSIFLVLNLFLFMQGWEKWKGVTESVKPEEMETSTSFGDETFIHQV
jgi:hypothetical protein